LLREDNPKTNHQTANPAQPATNPPASTQPHSQPNSPSKLASNKADSRLRPLWEGSLLRDVNLKPATRSQIRRSRSPIQQQPPSRTGTIQFAQQAGLPQSRQPPSLPVGGQFACTV